MGETPHERTVFASKSSRSATAYSTRSFAIASSRAGDNSLSILPHLIRYTSEEMEAKARSQRRSAVGVGIMLALNPLHGSGRAGFPHPAFDFGDHAHATQGIRMTDSGQRQLAGEQTPHTIPKDTAAVSAPIGIHRALERAREAAGEKDVWLSGGTSTNRQCLLA
jgi:hypothetical protein